MTPWFVSSSPASGSVLTVQSLGPASDSVSPSLSAPPSLVLSLSLSLSLSNIKIIKVKNKNPCCLWPTQHGSAACVRGLFQSSAGDSPCVAKVEKHQFKRFKDKTDQVRETGWSARLHSWDHSGERTSPPSHGTCTKAENRAPQLGLLLQPLPRVAKVRGHPLGLSGWALEGRNKERKRRQSSRRSARTRPQGGSRVQGAATRGPCAAAPPPGRLSKPDSSPRTMDTVTSPLTGDSARASVLPEVRAPLHYVVCLDYIHNSQHLLRIYWSASPLHCMHDLVTMQLTRNHPLKRALLSPLYRRELRLTEVE
uniref:uncharacterized protein LOC132674973 n=1 Tax=Panthera onca TaxID=9690 RepID=UPI002954D01A|nr:uncharacterized protein LOC132674973 [Panthera onca]